MKYYLFERNLPVFSVYTERKFMYFTYTAVFIRHDVCVKNELGILRGI